MHAFLPTEDFTLTTNRFSRHYLGGVPKDQVQVDRLIVDIGGESDILRKALEEDYRKRHPVEEVVNAGAGAGSGESGGSGSSGTPLPDDAPKVNAVAEGVLIHWSGLPPRLGRLSSRFVAENGLHLHPPEGDVLAGQLAALKARHPAKRHFRLAVVNAFGTNLGDCILGMTAFRHIAKYLQQHLPSFTIDLLLGANSGLTNFDIAGHESWVGEQILLGPTLQEFARYDAYFDITGLISLPRITEMPIGDWYLWWNGLDPATVPASEKRNVMYHPWQTWTEVSKLLSGIKGTKIFFNPKASVPLRTFAEEHQVKFLKSLLKLAPDVTIIVDREINLNHPRLVNLSKEMNSATKFAALVAQMDGVITVDSFAIHAADCANVPTVGLFASIDPYAYPFYVHHKGMLIPGGETLPAYKKFKTSTDDEWAEIKGVYADAWAQLDPKLVWEQLQALMASRGTKPPHHGTRMINGPHTPRRYVMTPAGRTLPFENTPEAWTRAQSRMLEIAKSLVKPRGLAVLSCPGQSPLPVGIAGLIGREGVLHIVEPRPERRQLIAMDLLDKSVGTQVEWHDRMLAKEGNYNIPREEVLSETNAAAWPNSRVRHPCQTVSIDGLGLKYLNCLILTLPTPYRAALESAMGTLERTRAGILCGPVASFNEVRDIATLLAPLKYQCWLEQLEPGKSEASLLLILPEAVKVQGLKRVDLK